MFTHPINGQSLENYYLFKIFASPQYNNSETKLVKLTKPMFWNSEAYRGYINNKEDRVPPTMALQEVLSHSLTSHKLSNYLTSNTHAW